MTDQLNSSSVKGQILIMGLKQFPVKRTVTKECFVWKIRQKRLPSYTYGGTEYTAIIKFKLITGDESSFHKQKPSLPMHSRSACAESAPRDKEPDPLTVGFSS